MTGTLRQRPVHGKLRQRLLKKNLCNLQRNRLRAWKTAENSCLRVEQSFPPDLKQVQRQHGSHTWRNTSRWVERFTVFDLFVRRLLIRLCSWQPLCSGRLPAAGSGQSGLCLPAAISVSSTKARSSEHHHEFSGSEQKKNKNKKNRILRNRKKGGPLIGRSDSFSAPHMSPSPTPPPIWCFFFPFHQNTCAPHSTPTPSSSLCTCRCEQQDLGGWFCSSLAHRSIPPSLPFMCALLSSPAGSGLLLGSHAVFVGVGTSADAKSSPNLCLS